MTRREIYDQLHYELFMIHTFKGMHPDGPSEDKCMRMASIVAVKNTEYWFNHQEDFIKYSHWYKDNK